MAKKNLKQELVTELASQYMDEKGTPVKEAVCNASTAVAELEQATPALQQQAAHVPPRQRAVGKKKA